MATTFVIRNQDGHYLTKKEALWLDGSEANYLFKTPHEDIALNTLIETNSQQIHIRGEIVEVDTDKKGMPVVEISEIESKMPTAEVKTGHKTSETEEAAIEAS